MLLVAFGCWYAWMRWSPLEREARGDASAILNGNVSRLMELATPEEKSSGLDVAKLQSIYDISVKSRMSKIASLGELTSLATADNGSSAVAKYTVRLVNGRHFYLGLQIFNSESGAKTSVAQTLLSIGWQLDCLSKPNYVPKAHDIVRSTLEGIRADRDKLQAAGVLGVYSGTTKGFMTWDKLEEMVSTNLARDEASDAGKNASIATPMLRS